LTFPGAAPLLPGALTTVEVLVAQKESTLSVPSVALVQGGVWVVDAAGLAHLVSVELGSRARNQVEILSGLQSGDQVVVAGASLLSDGVQTRIVGG